MYPTIKGLLCGAAIFAIGGSAQATTVFITSTSATTWTVPADFSATNTFEIIGCGGNGAAGVNVTSSGAGGGGGAYVKV